MISGSRSQGFGDEGPNAMSCLVPLVCHLVTTMLTTKKLVSRYPHYPRLRKSLCGLRYILGPTAPSVAFDLDLNSAMIRLPCTWLTLLTIPVNLAGLPRFRSLQVLQGLPTPVDSGLCSILKKLSTKLQRPLKQRRITTSNNPLFSGDSVNFETSHRTWGSVGVNTNSKNFSDLCPLYKRRAKCRNTNV